MNSIHDRSSFFTNNKVRRFSNHQKGFTLIETIVVMVILAVAMSGALYILSTILFATEKNQYRLTAVYLAQECAELGRNVRDTAWKKKLPWDCAFNGLGLNTPMTIAPDHNHSAPPVCGHNFGIHFQQSLSLDDQKLYQQGSLINHNHSGDALKFRRFLEVTAQTNDQIQFDCEVNWEFRGNLEKTSISSVLTNWRKE